MLWLRLCISIHCVVWFTVICFVEAWWSSPEYLGPDVPLPYIFAFVIIRISEKIVFEHFIIRYCIYFTCCYLSKVRVETPPLQKKKNLQKTFYSIKFADQFCIWFFPKNSKFSKLYTWTINRLTPLHHHHQPHPPFLGFSSSRRWRWWHRAQ